MALNCEFEVGPDCIVFITRSNGDRIELKGFDLDAENAANLATMINEGMNVKVELKEIET